jgi:hypothetical protein
MLESVVLKGGPHGDHGVDPGLLAEALIYYGHTRLILKPETIRQLLHSLGYDLFTEVLFSGVLDLTIQQQHAVTMSTQTAGGIAFNYGIGAQAIGQNRSMSPFDFVELHLHRASGRRGWSRRTASGIMRRADILTLSNDNDDSTLSSAAQSDLSNSDLFRKLVALVLRHKAPSYEPPKNWRCVAIPRADGGYSLLTDLDISAIEAAHVAAFPASKVFGVGNLVGLVVEMHEELRTQCVYAGDLQTDPLLTAALRTRINASVEHTMRDGQRLDIFQDSVLPNGRKLREAVNAGEVNFRDVLKLHAKRERFTAWIAKQPADADLLEAYLEELGHHSILGWLPSKPLRFLLMNAAGVGVGLVTDPLIGIAGSLAISAFDAFLYDKLARGWSPAMYVAELSGVMSKSPSRK